MGDPSRLLNAARSTWRRMCALRGQPKGGRAARLRALREEVFLLQREVEQSTAAGCASLDEAYEASDLLTDAELSLRDLLGEFSLDLASPAIDLADRSVSAVSLNEPRLPAVRRRRKRTGVKRLSSVETLESSSAELGSRPPVIATQSNPTRTSVAVQGAPLLALLETIQVFGQSVEEEATRPLDPGRLGTLANPTTLPSKCEIIIWSADEPRKTSPPIRRFPVYQQASFPTSHALPKERWRAERTRAGEVFEFINEKLSAVPGNRSARESAFDVYAVGVEFYEPAVTWPQQYNSISTKSGLTLAALVKSTVEGV